MFQMVSPQDPLSVLRLGSSLPALTKGGSSVEEVGVDFRERKGEKDQMASLSACSAPARIPGTPAWDREEGLDIAFAGEREATAFL